MAPAFIPLPYCLFAIGGLLLIGAGFSRNADEHGLITSLSAACFVVGLIASLGVA